MAKEGRVIITKSVDLDASLDFFLNSSFDLIVIIDVAGGQILRVNKAAHHLLGYTAQQLVGRHYSMLFRSERESVELVRLKEPTVHGGVFTSQELLRFDGSVCPVDVTVTIIPWKTGHALLANFRDVTDRKKAEERLAKAFEELEHSRDDMMAILDQMRIGTAITDPEGRVTFISRAAKALFGAGASKARGKAWTRVFPLDRPDTARLESMAALAQRQRSKLPLHIQSEEGRQCWVEAEVYDDPRDPRRRIFCFYDVSEIHDLRRLLDGKASFHEIVGRSNAIQRVFNFIRDVAGSDITVLIEGETGTGKELVARAIHFSSQRKDKPFIPVNCAGLTDSLIGSQLFGHRRGSFTGASADQQGLFEAATGGTIFLDEIGDIPQSVQTSLLRVLQEREITRIGEHRPRKVDVRVLAATNRDLAKEVAAGRFREDLFYRVRVARVQLPALRDRREDIPLLVAEFLRQSAAITGKKIVEVSQDSMEQLLAHRWPGNVRELKSAIDVAVLRCKGSVISLGDLPEESLNQTPIKPLEQDPETERQLLLDALARASGNRTRAARLLGMSRATFYRRLETLNIPVDR